MTFPFRILTHFQHFVYHLRQYGICWVTAILAIINFCEFSVYSAYVSFLNQSLFQKNRDELHVVPTQRPYCIKNKRYVPQNHLYYDKIGLASWYGPGFHNRPTSSGKIFNMYHLTAAHATLPLNSIVRVTNLNNGRSVEVIVNDHGPFHHNRIIDLSKGAAQRLGFQRQGVTPVRVECLLNASRQSIFKNCRQLSPKTVKNIYGAKRNSI